MAIKVIYTFLIGIFLAVFIGVGIAAFYPAPKAPDTPAVLKYGIAERVGDNEQFEEFKIIAERFDTEEKGYYLLLQSYNRNVSIIAVIFAIGVVVLSLTSLKKLLVIADGLLLGGVLTLMYSVIMGFGTDDNIFRFFVVTVGFMVSLVLGYIKFIQPQKGKK